jgi:hypothetical protein
MKNVSQGALVKSNKPPIALRVSDASLYDRIEELSKQQNISMNLAVNMLLGFAFNEVDRQKKTFVSKIVFESK